MTIALFLPPQQGQGGPLRQAIARRRAERQELGTLDDGSNERGRFTPPANVRVVRDVAYGVDHAQRFDVYAPKSASHAPVILMVHGGGWRTGDKALPSVVENKVKRWVASGIVVISVNYRLLPGADPLTQAQDVGRALSLAQLHLADWGGDPAKVVLMGHSAGAHLVSLIAADPGVAATQGTTSWIGVVILDSAALDVIDVMEHPHLPLYTAAFGADKKFWRDASPYQRLSGVASPMLVVCSSRRNDSCPAARKFVKKANSLGARASVLEENLSHREINVQLGTPGEYTDKVEQFLRSVDGSFARALPAPAHR